MASSPTVPITIRNLKTRLYDTFDEVRGRQEATALDAIVTRVPSTTLFNTYSFLGLFPEMREWVGQRYVRGLSSRAYQVYNKKYELTIGQDDAASEDLSVADMQFIMRGMATAAVNLPRNLIVDLLRNGQSRAAYDGQSFFDTDHPVNIDSVTGTQRNYRSSAFALTRANYITARAEMMQYQGENARSFGVMPTGFSLVVPPQLYDTATDIVAVDYIAITGGVQRNNLQNTARVVMIPELAVDATTWYLVVSEGDLKPFLLQERKAPQFVVKASPTDDNKFWHGEDIFGVDARYGAGYGAWWKAYKAVG